VAGQPGGGQLDGVEGTQQQVGFDHGGAHDVLVGLDVLEGVELAGLASVPGRNGKFMINEHC
jgi:hypothetical protein